jgi:hypothetical protein
MKKIFSLLLAMCILCGACGLKERGAETAGTAVSEQSKDNAKDSANTPTPSPSPSSKPPTPSPSPSLNPSDNPTSENWFDTPTGALVSLGLSIVTVMVMGFIMYKFCAPAGAPAVNPVNPAD